MATRTKSGNFPEWSRNNSGKKAESLKFQSLKPILARAVGIDTNAHMHEKIIKPSNSVPCQWCHPSYCTSTKHVYYQNGTNFFLNVIIKFHEKFTKILMWHIKLLYWLTIFFKYCIENAFWKTSFDWNSSESGFWYVFTIIILIIINIWIQHVTKVTKTFFRQILRLEYVTHNDHFVSYKHFFLQIIQLGIFVCMCFVHVKPDALKLLTKVTKFMLLSWWTHASRLDVVGTFNIFYHISVVNFFFHFFPFFRSTLNYFEYIIVNFAFN